MSRLSQRPSVSYWRLSDFKGALAAVQVHNTYVDAEEQRLKKRNKGKKLLVEEYLNRQEVVKSV